MANKIAQQWAHRINKRWESRILDTIANTTTKGPSMVQLVRGSLIESLDRGSNPWLGPRMSSHSPLGPSIQGPG
jgi:hypothetical protein